MKILLIDDSEADQFLAKLTLKKFDPEVEITSAYTGAEGLEALKTSTPDLILLDINMPVMDGHEFLAEYEGPATVVMLTSSYQDRDRDRCLAHECVRKYLVKPLSVRDLSELAPA